MSTDDVISPAPRTVKYALVSCPACKADLSTVCLGASLETPVGKAVVIYHPLRCPECKHPLLALPPLGGIALPDGRLT